MKTETRQTYANKLNKNFKSRLAAYKKMTDRAIDRRRPGGHMIRRG